jgi:hypothetical protein
MSVINATPLLAAAGGDYQISRSVRLRSSASAYFNRTPASAGNRKTWTWSAWFKRGTFTAYHHLFSSYVGSGASDSNYFRVFIPNAGGDQDKIVIGGGATNWRATTQVLRDPSAWYHLIIAADTTQATANNRFRVYLNGSEITSFSTLANPTQNLDMGINQAAAHYIGSEVAGSNLFDGYLTEVNFIDGQALTPSSFGETDSITGVWKPKKYAGTYGTNGFYLNFSDNSSNTATTIGKDNSGNGNNWTPNNISVTSGVTYDSMLDVPTMWADGGNGRGNYCTLSPVVSQTQYCTNTPKSTGGTIRDGNLTVIGQASNWNGFVGTYMMTIGSGQWYWEVTDVAEPTSDYLIPGIINEAGTVKHVVGSVNFTVGDVIGFIVDGTGVGWYKNGVSRGYIATGLSGNWYPQIEVANSNQAAINFGQRPFAYTPPTGFKALNTFNLPDSTIKKGSQYFDVSTWTGDGTSSRAIVNSGAMQPDLVWVKARSKVYDHFLSDSVRGIANKQLSSNATGAETTWSIITAANQNGFQISSDAAVNTTSDTYVGWQWKESPSAGFDIVTYTGNGSTQNVAHSLGVAPKMMIVKARSGTSNWTVYHASLGNTSGVYLNLTNAVFASSVYWNNTSPTSTQFTLGSGSDSNSNGVTYVAYLFAEVAGFSKFGSYTGNGSADGPFVFCGFRPKFVMVKRTDTTNFWLMMDTTRNTYNVMGDGLLANTSGAEFGWNPSKDILSNGFKVRTSDAAENASGGTYIFAAFAESPFKNSLAR